MKKTHYYIVDTSVVAPGAAVSELQFNIIKEEPFFVHDLKVTLCPGTSSGLTIIVLCLIPDIFN